MFTVTRDPDNPFVAPDEGLPWQAEAAYNPSPVMHDGALHVLYRAAGHPSLYAGETVELSVVATAKSNASGRFRGHGRRVVLARPAEPRAIKHPYSWAEYWQIPGRCKTFMIKSNIGPTPCYS